MGIGDVREAVKFSKPIVRMRCNSRGRARGNKRRVTELGSVGVKYAAVSHEKEEHAAGSPTQSVR